MTQYEDKSRMGAYSSLAAEFHLRRLIGSHLLQTFFPSILIVAISWISFWMDTNNVTAKLIIQIIALFAVCNLERNNVAPQVSYLTAIDIWIGVWIPKCILELQLG